MTYYLSHPQSQSYRTVMAVPYLAVPQYRQPITQRYIQQPSSLTRMITQNYLALSKHSNPSLQTRVNVNYPQELKYYVPVSTVKGNYEPIANQQYSKSPSAFQYVNTQIPEQLSKQQEADYDEHEQEPHVNLQYAKPPADEVIQFAKPEVQQYVTKFPQHFLDYPKHQGGADYETGPQTQYTTKHNEPQQYIVKADDPLTAYQRQKPTAQFVPKVAHGLLNYNTEIEDEPEYERKPLPTYKLQPGKGDQTSVTITQSQEIEVDPPYSTPAPFAKYHATYLANPESYSPHHSDYKDKYDEIEPEILDKNLNDILRGGVSLTKTLPETITSENLDSSIKTLSKLLRILQAAHSLPHSAKSIIQNFPNPSEGRLKDTNVKLLQASKQKDDRGSTPGRAGIDYPVYDEIPKTHFSCKDQRYKGFFGDPETKCQVWHYCDLNGGQASFLCPNGTIFSQVALTCDWWFNVKCASTAQLYVLNERLYKFILPQKPSFPEDYAGPLVDHYLTEKFKEIEEKGKNKTEEVKNSDEEFEPPYSIDQASQNKVRSVG